MKAYLISDNVDTQVGMRLAGISGVVLHERDAVLAAIDDAVKDRDVGIILITEKVAEMVRDRVNEMKLKVGIPLIVEVPDRHGSIHGEDRITKYIKEAIGVKI